MKKILALPFVLLFCSSLFAQSGDVKSFRFGGTILPSLYWYSPDNVKKFKGDGSTAHFGVLINAEYSFSSNFAVGFGIGLSGGGGTIAFQDTAHYYFNDDAIIKLGDTIHNKFTHYKLNSRTYKATYYIIPISLKMRTNEIGHIRYFFQPGVNLGLRQKVRADDELSTLSNSVPNKTPYGPLSSSVPQSASQTDLDISDDMSFFTFSAVISAGCEYYLSGSTAVVFSLGYDYGLSNVVSGTSAYLMKTPMASNATDGKTMHEVDQKFYQQGLILSIGILF